MTPTLFSLSMDHYAHGTTANSQHAPRPTRRAQPRTRMKNWLNRLNPFAATLRREDDEFWKEILGRLRSASGVNVTPLAACGVATVYACVNRMAGSMSSVPMELYRADGKTRVKAVENPKYALVHDAPNEDMTAVDFTRTLQSQLTLRNQAFGLIVSNGMNEPVELRPVENKDIYPDRLAGKLVYILDNKPVPAKSIIHLRRGPMTNGIQGPELTSMTRDVIGLAITLQDNASKFFANGSRPGGVLETPNALSDRAFKRLKASFDKVHQGVDKAYATAILEEGVKFAAQRADNTDSQFVESRKQQDVSICQVMDMQPHKVGLLDKATFSNIEQQAIEYVTDSCLPNARIWEATYNQKMLTPQERAKGFYYKMNLAALLRGDIKSRYEAYAIGRMWGWFSANDVRALEELDPIEDGDDYLYPANQLVVGAPVPAALPAGTPAEKKLAQIVQFLSSQQ